MDGIQYHAQMKKDVLKLCKELKKSWPEDWPYYMQVLFPDKWVWLKNYKRWKQKNIKIK